LEGRGRDGGCGGVCDPECVELIVQIMKTNCKENCKNGHFEFKSLKMGFCFFGIQKWRK
jgi:hypothetical protein